MSRRTLITSRSNATQNYHPIIVWRQILVLIVVFSTTTLKPLFSINQQVSVAHGMKIVLQRVKRASVTVDQQVVSEIGPGLLALVGLHCEDEAADLEYCRRKLLQAKLWNNEKGSPWRHSVKQKNLEILCVSQFTLYGTLSSKKHTPDYRDSMKSEAARSMYSDFLELLRQDYAKEKIQDGVFGAMMDVELVNDGPVTLVIDSRTKDETSTSDSAPELVT